MHARRKFVEVAEMMKEPGRAHEAIGFYKALFNVGRLNVRPAGPYGSDVVP